MTFLGVRGCVYKVYSSKRGSLKGREVQGMHYTVMYSSIRNIHIFALKLSLMHKIESNIFHNGHHCARESVGANLISSS